MAAARAGLAVLFFLVCLPFFAVAASGGCLLCNGAAECPAVAFPPGTEALVVDPAESGFQSASVSSATGRSVGIAFRAGSSWVVEWNRVAIDASGLDHTAGGGAEQMGPGRSSRAVAIAQIAVYDAVAAVTGRLTPHSAGLPPAPPGASLKAAIGQAAHDALAELYPSQRAALAERLSAYLLHVPAGQSRSDGIAVGAAAAAAVLADRRFDGSNHSEPLIFTEYVPRSGPGFWSQDPVAQQPVALGARWAEVRPFAIPSAAAFRLPPPPALDSDEYTEAFRQVTELGGDGVVTPTNRTAEQTEIGIYWAYDGAPSLCAPPRLYNQIAVAVAQSRGLQLVELARLLALVNVAMADAGIAAWDSKYHYELWRPVTGVRLADEDGNPATAGDPTFTPKGAPASNTHLLDFTPPFPAYPSGHATFGGALFQTLRRFFDTDAIPFSFVSDELNGVTRDHTGAVRPLVTRHFETLSQAEEENGMSRVYLGIHWIFDSTTGITMGRQIADHVFDSRFSPA